MAHPIRALGPPGRSRWRRPIAAHLSIGSLDRPIFAATAGSIDPVDQLELVAASGFTGVGDNMFLLRSKVDQKRMGRTLLEFGLELCSISMNPLGTPKVRLSEPNPDIEGALDTCFAALDSLRNEGVATGSLTAMICRSAGTREEQLTHSLQNLDRAARYAERFGLRIGLEAVSPQRVADTLVERTDEAAQLVEKVGSAALGLVVDSAHSWFAGDDFVDQIRRYAHLLTTVQIADMPERVEPGAGEIDFSALASALDDADWAGCVEAEFYASKPGIDGEGAVLVALDRLFGDPRVTATPDGKVNDDG